MELKMIHKFYNDYYGRIYELSMIKTSLFTEIEVVRVVHHELGYFIVHRWFY